MTGSHELNGGAEPGEFVEADELPPVMPPPIPKQPQDGASYSGDGLYVLAFAIHRLTGGQLDWGLPVPFAFQDGATFEFTRPDPDGL